MRYQHAVAWLDDQEARVYLFDCDGLETIGEPTQIRRHQKHRENGRTSGERASMDAVFHDDIVHALEPAAEWLICGPGLAKVNFIKHVEAHAAQLCPRIVGTASAGHPSDGEMMVQARSYFGDADRMLRPLG
jgi:stalled ribosome rescue protein Dom34